MTNNQMMKIIKYLIKVRFEKIDEDMEKVIDLILDKVYCSYYGELIYQLLNLDELDA